MSNRLFVVGVGPGNRELVSPEAMNIIEKSDVLMGGKRNLQAFDYPDKLQVPIGNNLREIIMFIQDNIESKRIVVLASGDPNLYGITDYLKAELKEVDISIVPGISSIQYLCSKAGINLNDVYITSVHGREENLTDIAAKNKKTAVFTGGKHTPKSICRMFCEKGLEDLVVTVGENLSYENERVVKGTPQEIANMDFDVLSVMVIENNGAGKGRGTCFKYTTHGLPDHMFIRGDVPMTKQEVRAVSLSKLKLKADSIVYDIGAGTGSISIECGLLAKEGFVYAIEKDGEALELIEKNISKFQLDNIKVVKGEAPLALDILPEPDRVFVGGSGGNMEEIIEWVAKKCRSGRVVVNTITLESTYEAIKSFESQGFTNIEITGVGISRSREVGGKHIMQALNPVYVICADLGGL
ncbi:MAG: precorrin-6y C5,15-methyltransferase (decarboxylating) subunit CbiE [Bacillota bacterium]